VPGLIGAISALAKLTNMPPIWYGLRSEIGLLALMIGDSLMTLHFITAKNSAVTASIWLFFRSPNHPAAEDFRGERDFHG
jgi:hypothetical protein